MCAEEPEAYKQLDAVGKQCYTEKVQLLGLTGDPYMLIAHMHIQKKLISFQRFFCTCNGLGEWIK